MEPGMAASVMPFRHENLLPNTPQLTVAAAILPPEELRRQLRAMVGDDVHALTLGAVQNALAVLLAKGTVGLQVMATALASMQGLPLKNAQRRFDELLLNARFDPWGWFAQWVPFVVAQRTALLVALDWTDFDPDGHSTIYATVITSHGRATPLVWRTVKKAALSDGGRTDEEDRLLMHLHEWLPVGVHVTLLADRGFADQKLVAMMTEWNWSYVIRLRKNITITDVHGVSKPAGEWLAPDGRPVRLEGATMTQDKTPLGCFVAVRDKGMKQAWLLACSADMFNARAATEHYGKRFSCEETFRDQQDPRFGMGMDLVRCDAPAKRDRLIMLAAMAQALLTLLGAAGEASGADRTLSYKKGRTYSLVRQGRLYYELLPTMPEPYRTRLVEAFGRLIQEQPALAEPLGYL